MVYTSFISCGMNEWRLLEGSNVVSGMIEGINHYWATIHCIHWNFCMLVYTEIWQVVTTKLSEQTSIHFFQLTLLVCQLELCCFSAAFLPLVFVLLAAQFCWRSSHKEDTPSFCTTCSSWPSLFLCSDLSCPARSRADGAVSVLWSTL